ncbi:hypothetical protein B484DRAFT_452346 [Ochromonadaceae sp. CCMP2298]|nr:hypothetical protein B484DRAFT_452346 [Ochromonadaceae sp. CCMP2298]|eukprot:CAMPEP_0173348814 /NCGR_PEP_ID=MMETSP1144-20121109/13953_1 /TAXON_ID=483371 /ORGANISM="non described non described, Strain CCMP2298" /LENGTH=79 /DNA_ID=CAMNT_0014296523 /DNA_START=383 /DNA_END=622 /DNA_ORIENTATION=+
MGMSCQGRRGMGRVMGLGGSSLVEVGYIVISVYMWRVIMVYVCGGLLQYNGYGIMGLRYNGYGYCVVEWYYAYGIMGML